MTRLPQLQSRIAILGLIFFVVFSAVTARLFEKSIIFHAQAKELAKAQHFTRQELPPKRGAIYLSSKDGPVPIALTAQKYQVLVVPKNVKDHREVARVLAEKLELNDEQEAIFLKINNDKLYVPPIKRRVDEEKAKEIEKLGLAGVLIIPEHVRFYPEHSLAAHITGFVDFEAEGRYGVEAFYNDELKGAAGAVLAEKDNKGRFISIARSREARDGSDLYLTIDSNVQFMVEQALKEGIEKFAADSGQIIVIDPKTGALLALAAWPEYDPNTFNELKTEDQKVFLNAAVSTVYEPGSIVKPIVVAGGLDTGKISPETEGTFSNVVTVQGYEIHTAQDKSFGKENVTQCLENSDNVCLVYLANLIGNEIMHENFKKFGVGSRSGVDLSGETTGSLLELKGWRDIHRATTAFGQGVSMTPLQLARAYATLANGGKLMRPYLVDKIVRQDGSEVKLEPKEVGQAIKPETAHLVAQMLISVVENGHGKKAKVPGFKVAGKTGTAQIPNPAGGYLENAHIGSFGGYFPADDPKYAMLVKFDRPKNVEFAESSAAPTFGKLANQILRYYQIPPNQPVE